MNHNLCIFVIAAFFSCVACGLSEETPNLSARTMALTPIISEPLFFATSGEEKWVPVDWSRRQPSMPTSTFTGEGILPLFRLETDPEGKSSYVLAHAVKIPSEAKEILLIAWMAEGKLRLHPVDDDFLQSHHDRWLLINLSNKDILFRVGDKSKTAIIKSKATTLYTINVERDKPATILGKARIRGDELKMFYTSYFPVKSGRRTIVIFSDDGEKIRTKLVADQFLRNEEPKE